MGVFDKFLDIMKLNDDEYDDDDFYDDDFEDDDFDEKPHRSIFGNKKSLSLIHIYSKYRDWVIAAAEKSSGDRYRSRTSQSGCGYGPGKPDRI